MSFFHPGALYNRIGSIPPVFNVFSGVWPGPQVELCRIKKCKQQFCEFFSHEVCVFSKCEFIVQYYAQVFQNFALEEEVCYSDIFQVLFVLFAFVLL